MEILEKHKADYRSEKRHMEYIDEERKQYTEFTFAEQATKNAEIRPRERVAVYEVGEVEQDENGKCEQFLRHLCAI